MENINLLFQNMEQKQMVNLLENVNVILKDSDAVLEKEIVKKYLRKLSENITFMVLGSTGVGKSSFLNRLFQNNLYSQQILKPTAVVKEIRYGAENCIVPVSAYTTREFITNENLQGISVIDMPGIQGYLNSAEGMEEVKKYLIQSDVIFAVFQVGSIQDYAVWDLLENLELKKIIFILNKCDLVLPKEIENSEKKLKQYMEDAGIQAPVFKLSSLGEAKEHLQNDDFGILREYIHKNIIGEQPELRKQKENVLELKNMLSDLSSSFELRKKQYEADAVVVQKIDCLMNDFIVRSSGLIENLKETLAREIEQEIDRFQDEIIIKLNPAQIKERFPKGSTDFIDYMNLVNENYQKRMTEHVNKKTQDAIRTYLSELEEVFEEATGYFRTRKSLLALEDKFYGTLAVTKNTMTTQSIHTMKSSREYYKTLINASQELFMKIWDARGEHDRKIEKSTQAGGAAGAVLGGGGTIATMGAVKAAADGSTIVAGALSAMTGLAVLWPVVIAIIGSVLIADMAKKISSAKNAKELEIKVRECIVDFKKEVDQTKEQMIPAILDKIDEIFRRELGTADKNFSEFRLSVNIDSRNIPALEARLGVVRELMDKIEMAESREL